MIRKVPKITENTADTVLEKIRKKAPFYAPEWTPGLEGDFGTALVRIFASMAENLASNLNDIPKKHLLSFLNLLNFSLCPALPAKTVLCFVPGPGTPENVMISAGTRAIAETPEGETIFFETEKTIAMVPSSIGFFCSADRKEDVIFDHSPSLEGNEPATLFSGKNLQKHIFYIGDEKLFSIGTGKISLNLKISGPIDLESLAENKLFIWEYAASEREENREEEGEGEGKKGKGEKEGEEGEGEGKKREGEEGEKIVKGDEENGNGDTGGESRDGEESGEIAEISNWIPFSAIGYSNGRLVIQKEKEAIETGKVNGFTGQWIRCRLKEASTLGLERFPLNSLEQLILSSLQVEISAEEIRPELLYYNDIPLEEEKEKGIQPFGNKPFLYDTFYIACSEVFSKEGYEVNMTFDLVPGKTETDLSSEKPLLSWEYWNGESWSNLKRFMNFSINFGNEKDRNEKREKEKRGDETGEKEKDGKENWEKETEGESPEVEPENFYIKGRTKTEVRTEAKEVARLLHVGKEADNKEKDELLLFHTNVKIRNLPKMALGNINGTENYWIRARLIGGNFGKEYLISKKNKIEPGIFNPPEIRNLKFSYTDRKGRKPRYLFSENNGKFENQEKELKIVSRFRPFEGIFEALPSVYLGFKSKLTKGPVSLFAKIEGNCADEETVVRFKWQYLQVGEKQGKKAGEWKELEGFDGTLGLSQSGILEFFVPEEMKALQLFGSKEPMYWIRLLFLQGKRTSQISGIYLNCVNAIQARTIEEEMLGFGESGQVYLLLNKPIIDAKVMVNEEAWLPEGEKNVLLKEKKGDVEAITDETGKYSEFWVKWEEVTDFSGSDGKSRHYILDRTSGEIHFGDGTHGLIPPLGVNNIKATYRSGGGKAGNLDPYTIRQLYSALKYVEDVYNPVASDGGCETETLEELLERAPVTFRHRNRGVSTDDIVQLAKVASGKIAKVKVLSGSDKYGNKIPGLVTAIIVPDLPDSRPVPTPELLQLVESYLKERVPNTSKLKVIGPVYYRVDVKAELFTTELGAVHEIENQVKTNIQEFLHPLKGGKYGNGWDFGQVPSESDFYSIIEKCNGVSYVKTVTVSLREETETREENGTKNGTGAKTKTETITKTEAITKTGNDDKIFEHSRLFKYARFSEHSNLLEKLELRKSALPCSGEHEINVLWKAERED